MLLILIRVIFQNLAHVQILILTVFTSLKYCLLNALFKLTFLMALSYKFSYHILSNHNLQSSEFHYLITVATIQPVIHMLTT